MTTLASLVALTIEQTRRPELAEITASAIRSATLRAHHVDFFSRDLVQHDLAYAPSSSAFFDFPNISTTLARLRTIKVVQSMSANQPSEQLEYREPDDLFTNEGRRRPHIYTLLGDTLRVYPSSPTGSLAVFYFQNPNVTTGGYNSWIATAYPDEIAAWAAAIVFARTGFVDMAAQFMDLHVNPFRSMLVESHLLGAVS